LNNSGHLAHIKKMKSVHKILARKREVETVLEKPRSRWRIMYIGRSPKWGTRDVHGGFWWGNLKGPHRRPGRSGKVAWKHLKETEWEDLDWIYLVLGEGKMAGCFEHCNDFRGAQNGGNIWLAGGE
jgi:hypothetical protein